MRWTPPPTPRLGARRAVRRFALLPVSLVNGDRLWLEPYFDIEEWARHSWVDIDGGTDVSDSSRTIAKTTVPHCVECGAADAAYTERRGGPYCVQHAARHDVMGEERPA